MKIKNGLIVILGFTAIGLAGYYGYRAYENSKKPRYELETQDHEVLESWKTADEEILYGAILRLAAKSSDATMLPFLKETAMGLSEKIQAASSYVLAAWDLEPALLKERFTQGNTFVKLHILRGLSYHPSLKKIPLIEEFSKQKGLDLEHQLEIFAALSKNKPDSITRTEIKKKALALCDQQNDPSKKGMILNLAANLFPEDADVSKKIQSFILDDKYSSIHPLLIRILAIRGQNDFFLKHQSTFLRSNEIATKISFLESLQHLNTVSFLNLMKEEWKTSDLIEVKGAILIGAQGLPPKDGQAFLDSIQNNMPESLKSRAQALKKIFNPSR